MKKQLLYFVLFFSAISFAQVGVNTTSPDPSSMLDISATDKGVLVPRVSLTNVTTTMLDGTNTAATGLLIWNTNATTVGGNGVGFYFFNGTQWMPITQTTSVNTLDQAYDQGGAGAGKNIDATDGAVRINGDDGFLVTGTFGTGNTIDTEITGYGTRMFFNPRKAAFRAGFNYDPYWNDAYIGDYSTAFGYGTRASGFASTAFGELTQATHSLATAFGYGSTASGPSSTAFGHSTTASNAISTAFGSSNVSSGVVSTSFGFSNFARSYGETVLGIGATDYTPSSDGVEYFWTSTQNDRLFVIGNAIDANANDLVDTAERSNALTIYKNGRMNINDAYNMPLTDGTANQVMTTNGAGNVSWQISSATVNTLDQAYDQGGAGVGKNIDATDGAVRINGDDGFLVTGTFGSGNTIDTEISGAGTRMFFNPRKAAFRAGIIASNQWDGINIGNFSTAFGASTTASGAYSFATGTSTTASGSTSTAFGVNTIASGSSSTAFGTGNTASGIYSFAAGNSTTASGYMATAFGRETIASGSVSTAFGRETIASGSVSTVFGYNNFAKSYGETVLGIGATDYTPSLNGDSQFRTANQNDRLFVIGNAIDTNANDAVDTAERRNALTIYKNGRMNINDAYNMPLTDGTANQVMKTDGAGNVTWQNTITANTLDQAYDQGGAGAGKNINATNGAVRINGNDGFLVTGTIASGSTIDAEITGTGTRMFFNPRKAAFRAGFAIGTQWNDVNLGSFSAAFGSGNTASGEASAAFGSGNSVSSLSSAAFGEDNDASGAFNFVAGTANVTSGENSTAIGQSLTVGGDLGVALGSSNTVNSNGGIAIGSNLEAFSGYETVLGLNSTNYVPTSTSGFNTNDRLLTIGNGATIASRSNALTIYKDGRMNINDAYTLPTSDGTTGQVLTTNGAGVTNWQDTHANFALAKMKIPANQVIPAASLEYLIFESIFDLNSNFNSTNNRFEVTEAGYYRVEANFNTFASYTATNSYEINIEINGLPVKYSKWNHIGSGQINRAVTTIEALSPGDYIKISVRGGSAFSINYATELTSFVVERIR